MPQGRRTHFEPRERLSEALRAAQNTPAPAPGAAETSTPGTSQSAHVEGLPSWRQGSNAIPEDWHENPDGTWTHLQTGTLWDENGYPLDVGVENPIDYVPPDERPDDYQPQPNPWQPDTQYPNYPGINNPHRPAPTNYIPGIGPLPSSGTAPPRFNMPDFQPASPAAQQPTGGPVPGLNAPPTGQVSGPARDFTPFGQPMGQFSAPRQYGGLPRSTGPWGVPGAWYSGQGAIAAALRGS